MLMVCLLVLLPQRMSAQVRQTAKSVQASGVVLDHKGEPVIGAAVKQTGTSNGVVTDIDGKFTFQVPSGSDIEISYIGFSPVKVKAGANMRITLSEDVSQLNELVVIGYGTAKKSDISGSVASVDVSSMMKKSPTNFNSMLQGSVAGVYVSNGSGAPNASPSVRIRGIATINNSADPLYVVDGVQMGTDINYLNPSDVESIEVLKDASATAIYGAKGANGVILVTTKKGKAGTVTTTASAELGIQNSLSDLDVLNANDYSTAIRQARANDGSVIVMPVWGEDYSGKLKTIDWQKEMLRTAIRQNYTASVTGGTEKIQGVFSARYMDNDGLVVNSNFRRFNIRAAFTSNINKYLTLGGEVNFYHSNANNISGNLRSCASLTPTMDYTDDEGRLISPMVVNEDGTYGTFWQNSSKSEIGSGRDNIYASQMTAQNNKKYNKVNAYINLGLNLCKGLKFNAIYSYNSTSEDTNNFQITKHRYNPAYLDDGTQQLAEMGMVNQSTTNKFTMNKGNYYGKGLEDYLTYNWSNDIHNITLMLGNSVSKTSGSWASSEAGKFPYETIRDISLTTDNDTKQNFGAYSLSSRFISYYGRVMYSLMDRYNLTASVRRDGSSHFGSGNRWGTFPSLAASWRITEEPFMKNVKWLSNAKLRFGWGRTGNSGDATDYVVPQLSNESTRYKFYGDGSSTQTATELTGYAQRIVVDENLKWETNEQTNFGLDLGFFNNALTVTLDYFIRTTKDLLLYESLRPSTGFQRVYTNYGKIRNKGFEFGVAYNKQLNRDWHVGVSLTGSTIDNKIIDCGNDISSSYGFNQGMHWQNTSKCRNGYDIGSWYGYRTDGIFTSQEEIDQYNKAAVEKGKIYYQQNAVPGDIKFVDKNGDGTITDDDMDILGNGFPDLNFGLNLSCSYKNLDFSMNMYGVTGQKILSYSAMNLTLMTSSDSYVPNILKSEYAKAWSPTNATGTNPRLSINDANWNMRCSDFWIKDANYLKISNIQVGYTLPEKWVRLTSAKTARIYVAINNLCTISPYNKYGDPELGGSILFQGLDSGHYPSPRTYSIGLNVQF